MDLREIERLADDALRLNHKLLLLHILVILEKAASIEEAKGQIERLLSFYAEQ